MDVLKSPPYMFVLLFLVYNPETHCINIIIYGKLELS